MFSVIKKKWHTDWFEKIILPLLEPYSHKTEYYHGRLRQNWHYVCKNENFLPEFILQYPQYDHLWEWEAISANPNLTISFILTHKDRIPIDKWNWEEVSLNENMTPSVIESNLDLPWVWDHLAYNPSIYQDERFIHKWFRKLYKKTNKKNMMECACMSYIEHNIVILSCFCTKFWNFLSSNPNLTPEFIKTHIHEDWSFSKLSRNPCITPELVNDTIDREWNWYRLSENPSIPISFVEEHIDQDWDWVIISYEKVTPDFYINHINHMELSLHHLSVNPNMMELILAHPDWEWDWNFMSSNTALPYWFVKENPDKKWNYFTEHVIDIAYFPMKKDNKNIYKTIPSSTLLLHTMTLSRNEYLSSEMERFIRNTKETVFNELMEVTWQPNRLQWVLDEDQKKLYV